MSAIVGVVACVPSPTEPSSIVGTLEDKDIDEASGLAVSRRNSGVFWVNNDDGPAVLYAISDTGNSIARVWLSDASNRDWEDLASYTLDDKPYLLVADIGDNAARRDEVRLYVLAEPDTEDKSRSNDYRRIDVEYPDGARDAEAIAVDVSQERALILTKRDIPAVLYSVSLSEESDNEQIAERLGIVESLPQPSRNDIVMAPKLNDWHWQPTAMDISSDGSAAVVLTPAGVYLFRRAANEKWIDAMQRPPKVISRTRNAKAESIAFNATNDAIYITLEQPNAPLFRLELKGVLDQ